MDTKTLFISYKEEQNPERWRGFPELMWELGFEMDCYNSAPKYDELSRQTHNEKEIQDQLLSLMQDWTTQEVGNCIFSRYRELTHWSDYGYPAEKGAYFFEKAFSILEEKLSIDWDKRNTIPSLREFTDVVSMHMISLMCNESPENVIAFTHSDEGQFYIQGKYKEYIAKCDKTTLTIPMLRGKCAREAAYFIKDLY